MNLRALLVDDERKSLSMLRDKIEKLCPDVQIVGETQNPNEAVNLMENLHPELVFLDVAMPVMSGFDVLAKIDNPEFEIIFVTAFDNYAIEAINNCAIGYVLKPIDDQALKAAVERAVLNKDRKNLVLKSKALIENLKLTSTKERKIAIPYQEGLEFVQIKNISHLQGEQGYTKIFLTNRNPILSSYNIGHYRKQLSEAGFFQVHKSHLINLEFVSKFLKEGYVVLSDNSKVPVSRTRKAALLDLIV